MEKGFDPRVKPFFIMKTLLRLFFRLLYHQFAFTYDLVAAAVSLNRWKNWVTSVLPFIEGPRVLEIGHGPGHLQRLLLSRGLLAIGLDESAQMGRLARRNLKRSLRTQAGSPAEVARRNTYTQIRLARGVAQALPFPEETFDTVVATFPTEYITDPATLAEIQRCLRAGGRLVVLPVALPKNRLLDGLFKVTHQRPAEALEVIQSRLREPFAAAGFETEVRILDTESGILLIVLAQKA
jgi:ubiquinone/menaquinone biosynthesis C-methylase UbiE